MLDMIKRNSLKRLILNFNLLHLAAVDISPFHKSKTRNSLRVLAWSFFHNSGNGKNICTHPAA